MAISIQFRNIDYMIDSKIVSYFAIAATYTVDNENEMYGMCL